jgi:hypothetical protein
MSIAHAELGLRGENWRFIRLDVSSAQSPFSRVDALTRLARCADHSEQPRVLHRPRRLRVLQTVLAPTGHDAERTVHDLRGKLLSMSLDELAFPSNPSCYRLCWHVRILALSRLTLVGRS